MSWQKEKEKLGKEIIAELFEKGMISTWYRDRPEGWTLVSGIWSPFYINLRPLCSYPELLAKVGTALGRLVKEECKDANRIVGIAMAGIPISISISLMENIPSCFTRKLTGVKSLGKLEEFVKEYGEHSMIEGALDEGDRVVLIDDLVTKFDSKLIAIRQMEIEVRNRDLKGIDYSRVGVLFDREVGAKQMAEEYGISLHSLIPFESKGIEWLKPKFFRVEYRTIKDYFSNPQDFQNKKRIQEISNLAIRERQFRFVNR